MKLALGSAWLLLFVGCFLIKETESIDYNRPINPKIYQSLIGQGFAVKYFTKMTSKPLKEYNEQNFVDVANAGFKNLRIRCSAWFYPYPYKTANFTTFLNNLSTVVDKCLAVNITPIISWAHNVAQANATEEAQANYVIWWSKVAEKLKKKSYGLSFNLFTEIGNAYCRSQLNDCNDSLKENPSRYNAWTRAAVDAIRATGGNNGKRILILGSPSKGSHSLSEIDKSIYEDDRFMMVEYHHYASGPNKKPDHVKYWTGNGTPEQEKTLLETLEFARNSTSLLGYFGAWMPQDNKKGSLNQSEVESFAKFFVTTLKSQGIPWTLNALEVYYNTSDAVWRSEIQDRQGMLLNMAQVLEVIKENM